MLYSQHVINDCNVRLNNLENAITSKAEYSVLKSRFFSIAYDMAMAVEECYFTLEQSHYRAIRDMLINAVRTVDASEDPEVLKTFINRITSQFINHNYEVLKTESFAFNKKNGVMKYTAIGQDNLNKIASAINVNHRTVNFIDPRCRDGQNLFNLKFGIQGAVTYGAEVEAHIADQARTRLNRIAKGPLNGSRISNEVFDVLLLEPAISWNFTPTQGGQFTTQERSMIQGTTKYLRPNGLFVLIIPYFRMHKYICNYIAKNFINVQVRKLDGNDFRHKGLVAITGIKRNKDILESIFDNGEADPQIFQMLRRLYNIDEFESINSSNFNTVSLPHNALEIEMFRGSILDMSEMEDIVQNSGCMDAFWQSQKVEKISENITQPLLPFNIGQIGLVLTSGCLDGIVDEGDGHCHLIKGRVSKQSIIENIDNGDHTIEVNETISNKVEINVILPDGTYKVLA